MNTLVIVLITLATLILWMAIGTVTFICRLGHKNKPEPLWVKLALTGMFPVIYIYLAIVWAGDKLKEKSK